MDVGGSPYAADAVAQRLRDRRRRLNPAGAGQPLPKAGVFANKEAEVVAENIAHAIAGQAEPARFDGHGDCFIEIGGGKAGFGGGDFYAEPKPVVTLRQPSWRWHLGKVWVEKSWLYTKL